MRIRQIDLDAYGSFTDASIDFGKSDGRMHLIYGCNETGKSTLLRAIWRFFYGDLRRSPDDYLHSVSNLRIGMTLELPSGEVVTWTRRGGGHQSLRDESGLPVAGSLMHKLLCDIDENTFQTQFAINHPQLRRGGEELHQENGELGTALFSAATGLSSIGRIASELDHEANESFKARGSTPPINKALSRVKELKDSLRKSSVSTAKYNEMLALRDEAREQVQRLQAERIACQDRERLLQRVVAGIPKVVRIAVLAEELGRLPATPMLGADFGKRRQAATNSRERTAALIDQNERRLQVLRETVAAIRLDPRAVELLPQLQSIEKKFGSFEKAQADRTRLHIEIAQSERSVAELRRALGAEQANAVAPPRQELQYFRTRLDHYKTLASEMRGLDRELSRIKDQLADFAEKTSGSPESGDLQPFRSAVAEALLHSTIEKELEKLALQIAQLSHNTEAERQSLAITIATEEFVRLELPQAATIAEFDRRCIRLDKQTEEAELRLKESSETRDHLSHRILAILNQGRVPTEQEVALARERRESLWREIRTSLNLPAPQASGKTPLLQKLTDDLPERFESAMREADHLADLLRSEANRIAERLQLEAERSIAIAKCESIQAELSKLATLRIAFEDEWRQFASTAPTSMRTPSELKEWQPGALRLQDQLRKLANLRIEQSQLKSSAERLVQTILDSGQILGLTQASTTLGAILPAAQLHLQRLEAEENRRLAAAEQIAQLRVRQADSRRGLEVIRAETSLVWDDLIVKANRWKWGAITDVDELDRLVMLMDELERLDADMREKRHRVVGIDRDAAELQTLIVGFAEGLNLPVSGMSLEGLFSSVSSRLEEARRQLEHSSGLKAAIQELENQLDEQRESLALAQGDLRSLQLEAAADSLEALPQIEADVQKRYGLEAEMQSIETQLDALVEDMTRQTFSAACRATDLVSARNEITELQSRASLLETQLVEHRDLLRTYEEWLRSNPTLQKVADDEHQLQETLSELASLVREHVKARLAAEVLQRAMQRYRDENQGELLRSGGEVFARLTSGAYSGIRSEMNDAGIVDLLAARGDQSPVPLVGLSDGALDQLYLALRIASLQRYFQSHPPMPFIVDDIFVMFDENRTLAALNELARMAEITQVIVFSHHAHVLELALNGLGDRCVTHELNQKGPFRNSARIHESHAEGLIPSPNEKSRQKSQPAQRRSKREPTAD